MILQGRQFFFKEWKTASGFSHSQRRFQGTHIKDVEERAETFYKVFKVIRFPGDQRLKYFMKM